MMRLNFVGSGFSKVVWTIRLGCCVLCVLLVSMGDDLEVGDMLYWYVGL